MKRRILASLLSLVMALSLLPETAIAEGETMPVSEDTEAIVEPVVELAEESAITVANPYSNSGITVESAAMAEGLATVNVSYAKANQMAGIGYSYMVNGEEVTGRAIAQQIDGDGIPQTDKNNIDGYVRDCTVYTFTVAENAENITVTVDGSTFWDYDTATKTLTISGDGAMADFKYTTISDDEATVDEQCLASFPWAEYKNEVENVIVKDAVTRIGNQAFRKFFELENLTVESKELLEIGDTVCMNDSALKVVDLTACTKLAAVGDGVLTYVTSDADITVKMAAPVTGLWRSGVNYTKANTKFEYTDGYDAVTVGDWQCLLGGDKCEIIAYTGNDSDIEIPASVEHESKTYQVTLLDSGLFQNNTKITSVAFADGSAITAIPVSFMSCSDLRPLGHGNTVSVILPGGIETIGASAFAMYSSDLTTFQIGNVSDYIDLTHIKSIGSLGLANLLTDHFNKKSIKISDALKSIGSEAFKNNRFDELVLTKGDYKNISVHSNAFGSLYLTNGVELEADVENADAIIDAVLNAKKVTKFTQLFEGDKSAVYTVDYVNKTVSLVLSSGLDADDFAEASWHGYAVLLMETIKTGDWEIQGATANGKKTCTIIGYYGQGGAIEIPTVIEGYTVKAIGDEVFKNNNTITKVTFEDGSQCEEIGYYAFGSENKDTSKLTEIEFPNTLKRIGSYAFFRSALDQFPALPEGLTTIGSQAFYNSDKVKTDLLVIPASVTEIGDQAFRWCSGVQKVQVNSKTLTIGKQAFLFGPSSATDRYIDLSAVEDLTMSKETYHDGNVKFNIDQRSGVSVIYVANDAIATAMNDETNYPDTFKKTTTSIVSINGGTVNAKPTGLSSVTRTDGSTDYTAEWYTDGNYTQKVENPDAALTPGTTYYAKWVTSVDSYQVAAIPDMTYTGDKITPDVVVTDSEGNPKSHTVDYSNNVDVGKAKATVTIDNTSVEIPFNIVKDMNPTVTMEGTSVTYGTPYDLKPTAKTSKGNTIAGEIDIKYYTDSKCTSGETDVAPVDAGTYYAKATLKGTENYATASSEPVKIVIMNASFNVVSKGYTGTYDGKPHSITVEADDAKISYSMDAGERKTYSSTVPTFTNVGEYTVYYRVVKANHEDVKGSETVKIAPAVLTATYVSESVRYGTSPALKVDVTGFVPGEDDTTAAGYTAPTVSNSNTAVGEYTLTPAGGKADNYSFNYVSGTLTIYSRSSGGSGSSSSGSSYTVSVPSTKNGDVTVSPKTAKKGDTVTITVAPDKGCELDSLTVKDANGNTMKLSDKGNGKYTFTMPGSKVTVSAEFVEAQTASTFADVPADAYYAKAVEWAVKNGITNGKANGLFGSDDPCTRGQIVTFLWRAAGSPAPKGTAAVPADVVPGSYCYNAVAWAIENGITNGFADGTFGVNNPCTRAQCVALLFRNAVANGLEAVTLQDLISGFGDAAELPAYAVPAMNWALSSGIVQGNGGLLLSNASCTRAQIVTFLYRAYQGK